MASPIPLLDPVTKARWPLNSRSILSGSLACAVRGELGGHRVGAEADHPGERGAGQVRLQRTVEFLFGCLGELRLALGQATDHLPVVEEVAALVGEHLRPRRLAVAGLEDPDLGQPIGKDIKGGQPRARVPVGGERSGCRGRRGPR